MKILKSSFIRLNKILLILNIQRAIYFFSSHSTKTLPKITIFGLLNRLSGIPVYHLEPVYQVYHGIRPFERSIYYLSTISIIYVREILKYFYRERCEELEERRGEAEHTSRGEPNLLIYQFRNCPNRNYA